MADMVGLLTDVSGIALEVSVHDNQKIANGDVVFNLASCRFNGPRTWLRHRSE
jgi:multidrug resistance efflux pump